jgi:hypothetical protein
MQDGPSWTRARERDFETVTLPQRDCDLLRNLLIGERVHTVVEIGLAYASSALAIGEALITVGRPHPGTSSSTRSRTANTPTSAGACARPGWNQQPR